jgi:multicomponent Na+:H+ antiporter subunit E
MLNRVLITTFLLFALWLLLSGQLDTLLLCLGMISCLFVTWLSHRLGLLDPNLHALRFNLNLPKFLPWFFLEVIKSNLDISWRILHPKLPISPNISVVPISQHSKVGKAVYANCITLTPGTYTLDINSDVIKVHSLTNKSSENLQQEKMSKRILALEANPSSASKH